MSDSNGPAENTRATSGKASPPYRDASLSVDDRVEDLLGRMTLAEKAGQMFHDMILMGPDGTLSKSSSDFGIEGTDQLVGQKLMTHFNLLGPVQDVRSCAEWQNRLQRRALETRLGIPITLSTDPRNHFTDNVGTGFRAGVFSQWPETLGLAAIRSPELVERFADVARQEYLAVGLRTALHPQVDLATEPRWARIGATFGEDASLTSELVAAYIRGFQGARLGTTSVSTMTKHFPGGGPQKDGEDPHFQYGREQIYPGNNPEYHLRPFKAAIEAGGSQMMPYYGMPVGTKYEEVGFAFNKGVITDLLRGECGFKGIVCTDWGLITDTSILGQKMPARAWGVEHLSESERVKKILEAGCDQLGGESRPELIVKLVEDGQISENRLDASVRRLLREKFILGLFDHPFADVEAAVAVVGNEKFMHEGNQAQRRSYTLLKNRDVILPLQATSTSGSEPPAVYIEGIDPALLKARGFSIVERPADAQLALLRLKAPYEPRPGGFEAFFHAGSLSYPEKEVARQTAIFTAVPSIVDLYLDRPAVVPEIAENAAALLVNYGSSSEAFLDVVFGHAKPEGKLPFDLPSSMAAVEASRSDVPYDTADPTFRFGDGLSYSS
jgi:beta-glucosidase